jgi:hypothetical protein
MPKWVYIYSTKPFIKTNLNKLVTAGGNGSSTKCFIRGGNNFGPPPAKKPIDFETRSI